MSLSAVRDFSARARRISVSAASAHCWSSNCRSASAASASRMRRIVGQHRLELGARPVAILELVAGDAREHEVQRQQPAGVGLGGEARCVELGERGEVARLGERALEAREGLGRVRIGGERLARNSDCARLMRSSAILEAILGERAGDGEVVRAGGAVAQRVAGALGGVRGARPVALERARSR